MTPPSAEIRSPKPRLRPRRTTAGPRLPVQVGRRDGGRPPLAPHRQPPGVDVTGLAQLVLRRSRFAIVLAAAALALVEARGGMLDLAGVQPAAWTGAGLLAGMAIVRIVGSVVQSTQVGVLVRRWVVPLGDVILAVAIMGLFPRLSDVTWALLSLPLVEAGLIAGTRGTLAVWVASFPLLVVASQSPVTDPPAQLLARAGVLVLIAAPLGVVSRGLMSATAAAYDEHARADERSDALTVVAASVADVVHRDTHDADRVFLETLQRLGAVSASLWSRGSDQDWELVTEVSTASAAAGSPQRSLRLHPSEAVATTGGVWVSLPDSHTVDIVIVASGMPRRRAVAGFATALSEGDGVVDAVRLLARHVAVAWSNAREFAELEASRQELSLQTRRDPLTGLANRTGLLEVLDTGCRRQRAGQTQSLLFLDMDGFKEINDTLGHRAGDAVLCAVAELLVEHVRPDDFVARLGGDEFCVLVRNASEPDAAQATAARLIAALETTIPPLGSVSASIGIATMSTDSTPEGLLTQADAQMYRAKHAGGRRYCHA